ncbi:MAG: hypothetical protein Q4D24_06135 [Erysipelotrichaceae bacterium]|nr:hypothetical protein [Erysipelotrichaceae bacterium]
MKDKTRHLLTDLMLAIIFFVYWAGASLLEGNRGFAVSGLVLSLIVFVGSYITTPVAKKIMSVTDPMKTYKKVLVYFLLVFVCFLAFTAFYAGMSYIAMYAQALADYREILTPALFMLLMGAVLLIAFMMPAIHTVLYTAICYFIPD